jgi:hypothetical protein
LPRVIRPEMPDVTFEIAARLALFVSILDVEDDFCTRHFGSSTMGSDVGNEEIADLCLESPSRVGLCHNAIDAGVSRRTQHDRSIPEGEFSVLHYPVRGNQDPVFFKPERLAKPADCRSNIPISQCGSYRSLGATRSGLHCYVLAHPHGA